MNHYIETAVKALVALQVIRMQQITELKATNAPENAVKSMQHDYQNMVDAQDWLENSTTTPIPIN